MIRLTVPELGRLQFSIDRQLKVPIFTFFGGKKGEISNLIFLTPKRHFLGGTTHNDVLSVGMCPKMRPVGVTKQGKKGQKLSCVKLAICTDHPRRYRPLKFCVRGRVREVVIHFKFHENRSRGLGVVGGRKSPSPIDKAHGLYNSLYYRTSRDTWDAVTSVNWNISAVRYLRRHLMCTTDSLHEQEWWILMR